MSISVSNDITSVMNQLNAQNAKASQASSVTGKLSGLNENSSDEELKEACKSFEAYMVEQVLTQVKDALIPEDEDENEYMKMFGDKLYEGYAESIAETGQLGIANQLYEAMKRNYGTNITTVTEVTDDARATAASSQVNEKETE